MFVHAYVCTTSKEASDQVDHDVGRTTVWSPHMKAPYVAAGTPVAVWRVKHVDVLHEFGAIDHDGLEEERTGQAVPFFAYERQRSFYSHAVVEIRLMEACRI